MINVSRANYDYSLDIDDAVWTLKEIMHYYGEWLGTKKRAWVVTMYIEKEKGV